jgi:cyclase
MLKKRIIGVVNVKDNIAVQSFGFNRYLPLGKPECLIENLDRWGADEIILNFIDLTQKRLGPDLTLLERIANLGIKTPLVYSGGIRNIEDGKNVIQTGADRICVTSLLDENPTIVSKLSELIGLQGVIGALPIGLDEKGVFKYNYLKKKNIYFKEISEVINLSFISELLLIDFKSEGYKNSFNKNLLTYFKSIKVPLIVFGGISDSDQIRKILRKRNISAICIGNSLNYKENKIQYLKKVVNSSQIREPAYQIEGKVNV